MDSLSSAAIDDIIERGGMSDWVFLREKTDESTATAMRVLRVCEAHCADPYAQRYHLWRRYARQALA